MSMHSAPKSRGKKGMVKEDFMKMQQQPQMQTVLRVNTQCQCEGCASKIRSIVKKTKGVESCKIDLEHGKVTVIGEVDQAKLIDKLSKKTDKQVELWGFPKGMNMNMNNLNNQIKNIHMSVAESGKGGKGNLKPQKKGGDERDMINFHQMMNGKGGMAADFKFPHQFKDMKMMPSKDPKSVKFQSPDHDDDESDYESDDYDDESFDESDEDHHDGHGHGHGHSKSSGGKKGFSLSSIPILNRLGSKKEEKKSKKEGKSEGGNKKGEGKKGGDEFQNQKQSGGKNNGKKSGDILEMVKNGGKNGQGKVKGGNNNGGGNNNSNNWTVKGQKGGGGGGGHAMNNMQHKFQDIDVSQLGANVARNPGQMGNYPPGQMGQMGNYPAGQMGQMGNYQTGHPGQMGTKNMGQMGNYPTGHPGHPGQMGTKNMGQMGNHPQGQMGNHPQGQMGNHPQGQMGNYPQGRMGNFQSTEGMIPGMAQTYNPYNNQQQQYMAMMMNQRQQQQAQQQQQQQQQAYANGAYNNNNMMYGRPMNYGPPPTPPHAMDNHFTQYFNDENTNSCSIM